MPAVHPRVCGERRLTVYVGKLGIGSSPRVRGTPALGYWDYLVARFIPACAGNAPRPRPGRSRRAVHPRVCGEREQCDRDLRPAERFIPACAGNAGGRLGGRHNRSVHPRVCGERTNHCRWWSGRYGSSPRVRGTLNTRHCLSFRIRFIPACAGNALLLAVLFGFVSVHPRVCGERTSTSRNAVVCLGSSPRVRGTHL